MNSLKNMSNKKLKDFTNKLSKEAFSNPYPYSIIFVFSLACINMTLGGEVSSLQTIALQELNSTTLSISLKTCNLKT